MDKPRILPPDLERMLHTFSVSGDEGAFIDLMVELYTEAGADRVEVDLAGNVFAWKGDPKRAVCAHTDTIGFMVSEIDEHRCTLGKIGGVRPGAQQRAVLHAESGDIPGLVLAGGKGVEPVFEPVDASALDRIQIGDRISYHQTYDLEGEWLQGPYLDNRLGCYLSLEALRRCDNVLAVATSTEETSGQGAKAARAAMVGIDSVLIVDVTYGAAFQEPNPIILGEGPVVSMKDSALPLKRVVDEVFLAAKNADVTLQREVCDAGGSDMLAFLDADRPMWAVFFGIASKYNHRPFEVVNLGDLDAATEVAVAWCDLPAPGTSIPRPTSRKNK